MSKHQSKKRKQKAASKKKGASTVSDAMAKKPEPKLIQCEFCEYKFDEACGRYGCPNCNGKGLALRPKAIAKDSTLLALVAVNANPTRPAVRSFPIIPTFGDAGAKHDLAIVLEDSDWTGHYLITDGKTVWLEPYEG
jgi:hypothetical protein